MQRYKGVNKFRIKLHLARFLQQMYENSYLVSFSIGIVWDTPYLAYENLEPRPWDTPCLAYENLEPRPKQAFTHRTEPKIQL